MTVEAGIVVLSGTAPSSDVVDQARATLEQLDGVLMVIDDVTIERGLSVRLGDSWRSVVAQLREVVVALPLYLAALAIVVLFWLLARVLRDVDFLYRPASERALLQLLLRDAATGKTAATFSFGDLPYNADRQAYVITGGPLRNLIGDTSRPATDKTLRGAVKPWLDNLLA